MLKKIKYYIHNILNRIGYDIIKKSNSCNDYPFKSILYNPNIVSIDAYFRNYSEESITNKRFYNIGSGSFRHKYWTNIDLNSDWYKAQQINKNINLINYDLFSLDRLPIEDSSAEVVYTSHTIEHINDDAAKNMFNETFRILKIGGIFRIVTPDTDLHYIAWRKNDRDFYYWIDFYSHPLVRKKVKIKKPFNKASLGQIFLFNIATHVSELSTDDSLLKISDGELDRIFIEMKYEDALDYCISKCSIEVQNKYPGWHMNWWNENKLKKMLKLSGFKNIYKSGYGQSLSPILRDITLFDVQDPKVSLYIEAIKE